MGSHTPFSIGGISLLGGEDGESEALQPRTARSPRPLLTLRSCRSTRESRDRETFLALAAALEQSATYTRILLSKPVVDVGRGIGFWPASPREVRAVDAELLR